MSRLLTCPDCGETCDPVRPENGAAWMERHRAAHRSESPSVRAIRQLHAMCKKYDEVDGLTEGEEGILEEVWEIIRPLVVS